MQSLNESSTPLQQVLHARLVCMARAYGLMRSTAPPLGDLMTDMEQHANPATTERSRMAAVDALDASGTSLTMR